MAAIIHHDKIMQELSKVVNSRKKSGGRQKGTPNRSTTEIRDFVRQILSENMEAINQDISMLKPYQRLDVILKLMNFCLPKPAQSTLLDKDEKIEVVFVNGKTIL